MRDSRGGLSPFELLSLPECDFTKPNSGSRNANENLRPIFGADRVATRSAK